jgi:ankyrin repeat protein
LHAAATGGHTKTCQLLIETSTADMTKVDKRNRTPFLLACGSDNPETPLYLATQIKEQDTSIFSMRTDTGKTPLTKAAARGHTEVVKMLLQKPDVAKEINEQDKKRLNTPLHVASMNGSKDIVELLLQHGASTTILDKRGNTPFNAACRRWAQSSSNDAGALILLMDQEPLDSLLANTDLLNTAAMKGNIPVLAKLLDKGASLNQQDEHGWTPLQLASQYGHTDAVKLLSERGAVVGRRPTRWKCDLETVKISEDGKTVEYIALGTPISPFPCPFLTNR